MPWLALLLPLLLKFLEWLIERRKKGDSRRFARMSRDRVERALGLMERCCAQAHECGFIAQHDESDQVGGTDE